MWRRKARPSGRAKATECGSCITTGLRRATGARSTSTDWSELSGRLVQRLCSSGLPQVLQIQPNPGASGLPTACARRFLAPRMNSLNWATTCRRPHDWRERCGSLRPDILYQRSNLYLLSGAWVARRFGLPLIEEVNAPYFAERSRHGGLVLSRLAAWSETYGVAASRCGDHGDGRARGHRRQGWCAARPASRHAERNRRGVARGGRSRSERQGTPGAFGVHGARLHRLHSGLERLGRGSGASGTRGGAPMPSHDRGRRPCTRRA